MADKNPFASVGLGMFGAEGQQGGLGQDALALATAYGIDKSGLKNFLNDKGFAKNDQGQWGYSAPKITNDMYGVSPNAMGPAMPPPQSSSPVAPVAPTIQNAVVPNAPAIIPAPITTPAPSNLGNQILNNEWHGVDSGDQANQNQFAQKAASEFVPGMGSSQGSDGNSDFLKQIAMKMMMG